MEDVGDLRPPALANLLRVLPDGLVEPVGLAKVT
jgi:transcriptional regulator with AAA-type ATPase domain